MTLSWGQITVDWNPDEPDGEIVKIWHDSKLIFADTSSEARNLMECLKTLSGYAP